MGMRLGNHNSDIMHRKCITQAKYLLGNTWGRLNDADLAKQDV